MNDDELEQAIAYFGLDLFGEETRQEVESLLASGQTVEPEARKKLIGAAQRALRFHAVQKAAFEVLAFELRLHNGIDIDEVALAVDTDPSVIRGVESGKASLRGLGPNRVAAWIHALRIDTDIALGSIGESLRPHGRSSAYAADDDESLDRAAQDFLAEVREALIGLREPH